MNKKVNTSIDYEIQQLKGILFNKDQEINFLKNYSVSLKFNNIMIFLNPCKEGDLEIAKYLYENNPEQIYLKDDHENSGFHYACKDI